MKTLLTTLMTLTLLFTAPLFGAAEKKDSPKTVEGAITIDASEAKKLFDDGVLFIDVRKDKDWQAGRIPGAEHLELKKVFSKETLSELVEQDQRVVLYCNGEKCMRSSKATAKAVSWGFKNVYYFRGGLPAWKVAKYPVE